ncbi:efflux RND transporter permease subunit [Candidatus Manganitrophus noduliformans]|uniref:Efflux RND transporter permease subunit n=1 Tax=Candidatus Manganitrophus noduliformans TaxID=2606439 RepID=A0A7X6DUM4_9BACT|nr:efflux RND transporter permease subunit [Candidatus Manganitrophus noduliformans]NKE73715.1 efflux RND transporter permease subunit [Candidatus Manganitrophus noduliformans]
MYLPEISIRRPVLATVMSLVLTLLGVISYTRLSVREYPKIDPPVVSVRTVYPGASAEIIESQITRPIESALAGIEGIKTMKSISREEVSQITIEFVLNRDPDAAANDVRDRVARGRATIPEEALESIVQKIEADAQAVMWIAFSSDRHTPLEITDYADRFVKDRLQTLDGVATVIIGGERRYAMRIWLDRDRLAAFQLTPRDVEMALRAQNVDVPSGRIESRFREFTVLTETDLKTPDEFNRLILREVNGYPVRLSDVGYAEVGAEDDRNAVRVNGNPAVGLGIVKQSTANTLEVAEGIKAELPNISAGLPEGMRLQVAFDSSVFIDKSINAVYRTIAEAMVLVVLVIFFFLRSFRATLIPSIAIPVSLIGAFLFMYIMGFSVNILTLLALVLAIGLVVDDAIVMMENIYRRIEGGMPRRQAALEGSREIAFAVVVMTITLSAVFVPLAFITGTTGRLFIEFALTVAGAVLVSGFVALTLTPMLSGRILKHQAQQGRFYTVTERWFEAMNNGYRRLLAGSLRARGLVVLLGLIFAGASVLLFMSLKSELAPLEDRGTIIGVMIAPEGSTMAYTDKYARQVEEFYSNVPEIKTYFMVIAPGLERPNPVNSALSFVSLKPWEERTRKQQEIAAALGPKMFGLPGVLSFPVNPPSLGQNFRNPPVQFVIQANSYEELQTLTDRLMEKMRANPGLANIDSDLKLNKPQLNVTINRDKAADVGVGVDEIGRTLQTLLGGLQVTRYKEQGEQYDVIIKLADKDRTNPADLTSIFVRGKDQQLVQLSNLVQVKETVAPKELNHFNRLRSATISANLASTYSLGEAIEFLEKSAAEILPATAKADLDGQSREFREAGASLYFAFVLALVFIYLVLAAQFESFIDPFVIMLSVPLAVTGALLSLWLTGGTLNVYSQIGMVMLIGLVTKNGILIVEFANQIQEQGKELQEAVIEASVLRLRPILMTAITAVLAAVPLALAKGAGAESRQQIGWVVVGGMSLGTLLTLFIIPTAYTFFAKKRQAEETEEVRTSPELVHADRG